VNEPLCNELRAALHVRLRVILLHPIENVPFEHYFDTCPRDLITAGLLKNIAVQLRSAPYEVCHLASPSVRHEKETHHAVTCAGSARSRVLQVVSAGLLAKQLGGKAYPKRWREMTKSSRLARASRQLRVPREAMRRKPLGTAVNRILLVNRLFPMPGSRRGLPPLPSAPGVAGITSGRRKPPPEVELSVDERV